MHWGRGVQRRTVQCCKRYLWPRQQTLSGWDGCQSLSRSDNCQLKDYGLTCSELNKFLRSRCSCRACNQRVECFPVGEMGDTGDLDRGLCPPIYSRPTTHPGLSETGHWSSCIAPHPPPSCYNPWPLFRRPMNIYGLRRIYPKGWAPTEGLWGANLFGLCHCWFAFLFGLWSLVFALLFGLVHWPQPGLSWPRLLCSARFYILLYFTAFLSTSMAIWL